MQEVADDAVITCAQTGCRAEFKFQAKPMWRGEYNKVKGTIYDGQGNAGESPLCGGASSLSRCGRQRLPHGGLHFFSIPSKLNQPTPPTTNHNETRTVAWHFEGKWNDTIEMWPEGKKRDRQVMFSVDEHVLIEPFVRPIDEQVPLVGGGGGHLCVCLNFFFIRLDCLLSPSPSFYCPCP